jgi:hypothetical protein
MSQLQCPFLIVMPGLDPGIVTGSVTSPMDGRVKPGHDGLMEGLGKSLGGDKP